MRPVSLAATCAVTALRGPLSTAVIVVSICSIAFSIASINRTRKGAQLVAASPIKPASNPGVVLVIGGGLAGICAAVAAVEQGASVVLLDRFHGGGTSAISGGVVYAGGGTKQQIEAGYGTGDEVSTSENMFRYLREEVGDAVDMSTLRNFCDESVARMEWLERHGVRFQGSLCPFRTSYPTAKYFLYFSGNKKVHPFATVAKPAPRGHRAVGIRSGGIGTTGGELWSAVFDSAARLGVRFEGASKVEELLLSSDGRVKGVRYRAIDKMKAEVFAEHKRLTREAAKYHRLPIQPLAAWLDQRANVI